MIARRADTKARADFATWKMMAKLNGASSLPDEAQAILARYKEMLGRMTDAEATEVAINLVYRNYYAQMGGAGTPPDVIPRASDPPTNNVTAFKRPPPPKPKPKPAPSGTQARPQLPVALIFVCLAIVYVGIRYYFR